MVVCKFFLQGNCKFGSYCHYDHQVPSNYSYSGFKENSQPATSILRQKNFGEARPEPGPTMDINTLVKLVAADMLGAEKGRQWLLSTYAPFKEKPAFPGFEDFTPEELRYGYEEAKRSGNLEEYAKQVKQRFQDNMVKVRALQNPSAEVVAILQNIYNTPSSSSSGTYGQTTPNQQSSNIFASQINPGSLGQGNDPFKNPQNIFANPTIFNGSQTQQTNVFATPSPNKEPFGASGNINQQSGNIFAPATSQMQSNIFATPPQSLNMFSTPVQTSPNIFAHPSQPQQNVFATSPMSPMVQQTNVFSPQNAPLQQNTFSASGNILANPAPGNMLTNPAPPQSIAASNYSASIFGGVVNTNPSMALNSVAEQAVDPTLYSKLEELGVEERSWFEGSSLDIMNVPDKPPTYEMCFKQ